MYTFILSILVVVIISRCFFKKDFWENRYLILLIGACVAFAATLTTNYVMYKHLPTRTEIVCKNQIYPFYVQDSIIDDSSNYILAKNYDYSDYSGSDFLENKKDSNQILTHYIIYTVDKSIYIGYFDEKESRTYSSIDDMYITSSENDTVPYITEKKLLCDTKANKWMVGFSLPKKEIITILHLPLKEFKTIPDSLIRKIPF
jgi:hypothetical protein